MSSVQDYLDLLVEEEVPKLSEPDTGSAVDNYFNYMEQKRLARNVGNVRAAAQGLTFGFADELEAAASDEEYEVALARIREQQKRYKQLNPGSAIGFELAGSLPTALAGAAGLGRLGVTSVAKQGAIEGSAYGIGSGESFEERAAGGVVGGLSGFALGKLIDVAITPSSAGGLRTEAHDLADKSLKIEPQLANKDLEIARANEIFDEVDNPQYTRKPLSEAKTAGELWSGLTGAVKNFYNDKVTGVSDELMRVVSPQVGARFQRADEAALATTNKELDGLSERLVPIVKIINDSERTKGVMLDYAAGKLGKTRADSLVRLRKELKEDLSTEHINVLEAYLNYSYKKNAQLNKKVFGAEFPDELTYLHTRNIARYKKFKDEGMTDAEIEKMFEDPGMERRTRGSYLREDPNAPLPEDYDNPIISDMQRIFKMERLAQVQDKFGVKIDDVLSAKKATSPEGALVALTPQEFLDSLFYTLTQKGISNDGAQYSVNKITDTIMGQAKTPHPAIQAANSLAYASTLAGPMSAILNLADIPLLGAKYGGRAALEGLKVLNPFKKIPSPDLQKMGLSNQTFGEFVNKTNELASNNQGFMAGTAHQMRKGADFLMKGSGFAAMDRVGKKGVMRGVLRSATDDAKVGNLSENWGFYFNDAELDLIADQLKKHGMDWSKYTGDGAKLIEELLFAGLGQQQLISAAGRPAAWARNPNLRPLWALRGFVVKQQALALREVMGNIKAGKPEKAAQFLGRYASYGAGGYAVINEGRQFIFGDGEASFNGLVRGYGDAWASLLTANTLGLNDYQYGQIKQNGLLYTFAEGMMPIAIDRPLDIGKTIVEVLDQERPPQAIAQELPLFTQTARFAERGAEAVGATTTQGLLEEALRKQNPNPN